MYLVRIYGSFNIVMYFGSRSHNRIRTGRRGGGGGGVHALISAFENFFDVK